MAPDETISNAIRARSAQGRPALVAFLTAGFPDGPAFIDALTQLSGVADVIEIGVPFSDPMADGLTIQRSSRIALERGVTLAWILEAIADHRPPESAPILLMSYLNPLLSYGLDRLATDAQRARVSGFIVPDLPLEECGDFRALLEAHRLALVQMATPLTPPARLALLARESRGFLYAVTMPGTTGKPVEPDGRLLGYLDRVRRAATVPVCAGFGIRTAEHVARLAGHVDGVIVGSALVEVLERGGEVVRFLRGIGRGEQADMHRREHSLRTPL